MREKLVRCLLFAIIILSFGQLLGAKDPKVLVLIVDSDTCDVYVKLRHIWSLYMHSDPEHVEVYFIRGDPTLSVPYFFQGDTLYLQTENNVHPGIITKTVMALEALSPRIGTEFDFVLRTNLSSFYIFDRLLKYLKTLPTTRCYSGSILGPYSVSGCGYIISPDVAQIMIENKPFLTKTLTYFADDDIVGELMHAVGISPIFHPRKDYYVLERDWTPYDVIPPHIFQVRVKNDVDALRLTDDMIIYKWLLEKFYHIHLNVE